MTNKRFKVRGLVMRNYIGSTIVSFLLFAVMIVMFGFDLEDEIFDYQVRHAAEQFIDNEHPLSEASGTARFLEMQYFIGTEGMPDWMAEQIDPGWVDRNAEIFAEEKGHFHVSIRSLPDGQRFYMLFNARAYIRSTESIKSYLVIIGVLAGVVFLVSLFFVYKMTRKVSAPLEIMASELAAKDKVSPEFQLPEQAPVELHALAAAIGERDKRIQDLMERERQFNRDASHELRTPLAVAVGAAEVLEGTYDSTPAFKRLKAAIRDMQQLTEGILWLGRDPGRAQHCNISSVCCDSIKAYRHLVDGRDVVISFKGGDDILMPVPEPVAHVMVGNILRNALSYTDSGEVSVSVGANGVEIQDAGVGFGKLAPGREGFGVGLALVERLCAHFGVDFSVAGRVQGGTKASLGWSKKAEAI